MDITQRAAGAVVGSAVGDALGAPFEFGAPGDFGTRFPEAPPGSSRAEARYANEMCGGGGWDAGEATDDTQMAVHVAYSLLERGEADLPDIFDRFRRWARAEPKDIGLQTEDVLTNGLPWDLAAGVHFQTTGRAAGNGSLMRATTPAVWFAADGRTATMAAARRIAALTHGDRAAWEGTAIFHELVRVALNGDDPPAALPATLDEVHPDHRDRYAVVLSPTWHPTDATEFNGARSGPVSARRSGRCGRRRRTNPPCAPPSTSAATPTRSARSPARSPEPYTAPRPSRPAGPTDCMYRSPARPAKSCATPTCQAWPTTC